VDFVDFGRARDIRENKFAKKGDSGIYRFIDLSIYRFIDLSIYRFIDLSIYRFIDLSIYRFIDFLGFVREMGAFYAPPRDLIFFFDFLIF